jgi:hypothetical protein
MEVLVMSKKLIYSNLSLRIFRLFGSPFDFEIEQPQSNGDLITFKTCDNARLTKWLFNSGICSDKLQALDLINHGLIT